MSNEKRVGVFFDGTGNHNKNDKGIDHSNSNVGRLFDQYDDSNGAKFYEKGVGTVDLTKDEITTVHNAKGEDSFTFPWEDGDHRSDYYSETAMALGSGMDTRVNNNLEKVKKFLADNPDSKLTIDVFGFSRGAAEARFFVNKVNEYINEKNLQDKVHVGFVGIFDTVESDNTWGGNGGQGNINLNKNSADKIVHFTAMDERRDTFDLTTLKDKDGKLASNMEEIEMIGVHSDVGGGYEFTKKDNGKDCNVDKEQCYRAEPSFRKCLTASSIQGESAILKRSLELDSFAKKHHYSILKKTRTLYVNSQAPALSHTEICATMEHRVYDGLNNVHLNLMADKAREAGVPLKDFSIDNKDYTYGVDDDILRKYYQLKKDNKPIPKDLKEKIESRYVNDSLIGLMNFDNDSGIFDLDGKARDIRVNKPNEAITPNKVRKQKDYGQYNYTTIPSFNKYYYINLPSINKPTYTPYDYNKSLNSIKYKFKSNISKSLISSQKRVNWLINNIEDSINSTTSININLENKSQKLFKKLGIRHEKIPTLKHNQNLPEKVEGMYRKDDLSLKKNPRVSDKKAEAVAMHEIYHHTQKDKGLELGTEEATANVIEKAYLNENQKTSQEPDFDLIYAYTIKQFYEHNELDRLVELFGGDERISRQLYHRAIFTIDNYHNYNKKNKKMPLVNSGLKSKNSLAKFSTSDEGNTSLETFDFLSRVLGDQRTVIGTGLDVAEAVGQDIGSAGRILAPVAVLAGGYQTVRSGTQAIEDLSSNNRLDAMVNISDAIFAGAGTAAGVMTLAGASSAAAPVLGAASAGYTLGREVDNATGGALSDLAQEGMTGMDRAISSVLPRDESLPEYKQDNRVAWWLIDHLGL